MTTNKFNSFLEKLKQDQRSPGKSPEPVMPVLNITSEYSPKMAEP